MQFIVKPNSSDQWLVFKRLVRLHSTRALIVFSGLVLFSSGFMFGLMFAINGSTLDSSTVSCPPPVNDYSDTEDRDDFGADSSNNNNVLLQKPAYWNQDFNKGTANDQVNSNSAKSRVHDGMSLSHTQSSITKVYLLVLIPSASDYKSRRDAIRKSWAKLIANHSIKYYFVLGGDLSTPLVMNELRKEQEEHNDMLILPHITDSYLTLTRKMLESFKWSYQHLKFRFVLKVDDDSFVRVDKLFEELRSKHDSNKRLYWGYFDGRAPIKKQGKWSEENWFLCDKYLPYALGGGYVLSSSLIKYIIANSHLLQSYQSEDVTIGTWLAPLNITRQHDPRFDTEFRSRGCSNNFLITHRQSEAKMSELYKNLLDSGHKLCKPEIMVRKAYFYNWKTNPSSCCIRNISLL